MRVFIIGNGAAGNQAADTLRKYDREAEIIICSQEPYPMYSACALPDYMAGSIRRSALFIKEAAMYHNAGIKTLFGSTVENIDIKNRQVRVGGENFNFDRLIYAAGSRAVIPQLPGSGLQGNLVLKSLADVDRIMRHHPKKAVVIGSGNIGVEAAQALHELGCSVAIIEMQGHVMPKIFDYKPAQRIERLLKQMGIKVFTGEHAREVSGQEKVEGILTDQRQLECDTVIWAAGVKANIDPAVQAGILTGEMGGIKVNSRMQTNFDYVYACGDCIETFDMLTGKPVLSMLWTSARRQGEIAALNCLGQAADYEGAFNVVVEEINGTNCLAMGLKEAQSTGFSIRERESPNGYYQLLIEHGCLAGLQAVGEIKNLGPLSALIKNRTPLAEVVRILETPGLISKMPWYTPIKEMIWGG
jgi:NADH oxidase (H2O2-forming)